MWERRHYLRSPAEKVMRYIFISRSQPVHGIQYAVPSCIFQIRAWFAIQKVYCLFSAVSLFVRLFFSRRVPNSMRFWLGALCQYRRKIVIMNWISCLKSRNWKYPMKSWARPRYRSDLSLQSAFKTPHNHLKYSLQPISRIVGHRSNRFRCCAMIFEFSLCGIIVPSKSNARF